MINTCCYLSFNNGCCNKIVSTFVLLVCFLSYKNFYVNAYLLVTKNFFFVKKKKNSGKKKCLTSRHVRSLSSLVNLPETHEMLRKTCRDFADNELIPIAAKLDKEHLYPKEQVSFFWNKLFIIIRDWNYIFYNICIYFLLSYIFFIPKLRPFALHADTVEF